MAGGRRIALPAGRKAFLGSEVDGEDTRLAATTSQAPRA